MKYDMEVSFTFTGKVKVEADNQDEAYQILEDSFGLTIGGNPHPSDCRILDWKFDIHPDKEISYKEKYNE